MLSSPSLGRLRAGCAVASRFFRAGVPPFLACIVLASSLHALDPRQAPTQYNLVNWRMGSAGARAEIKAIAQAPDGYLWTATSLGLYRFDGRSFTRVASPDGANLHLNALAPRTGGGVWIAADEGLYVGHRPDQPLSRVREGRIRQVLEAEGQVWFSTEERVFRAPLDQLGNATPVTDTPAQALRLAGKDVWLATPSGVLVARMANEGWAAPEPIDPEIATALAVTPDGREVRAGNPSGLREISAERSTHPEAFALADSVTTLVYDQDHALWIGTERAGLRRLLSGRTQALTKADGLSSDAVTALCEDREGTLWIGTSDGLDQLTETRFPILGEQEGSIGGSLHNVSPAIDGGVWVSSGGAFAWTDGREHRNYLPEFLGGNIYIKLIYAARDGSVYFVRGDRTINRMAGGKLVQLAQPPDWTEAIVEDEQGIVLSVGPKLYRLRGTELVPYEFAPGQPEPFFDWVHHIITAPDGALVLCTAGGLFRVKGVQVERWGDAEGIAENRTYSAVAELDGTLWAGGPSGLHLVRPGRIHAFQEDSGLPNRRIFALAADDLGYLWMMTGRGLARARRDDLVAYADGKLEQVPFDLFNGPPAIKSAERTDQNYGSAKTADGRIWFPSPRGLIIIDPANPVRNTVPPVVHVERSRNPEWNRRHPGRTPIEFTFAALSFSDPARTTVSYRMVGLDNNWIAAGDRRSVEFQTLPPGEYALEVRATNGDGAAAAAALPFQVLPPFYESTWFYFGCALGMIVLFGAAYGVKMRRVAVVERRLREENERLEEAVAERTRQLSREQALRVEASRRAGMAEVASNVLHNVGNVLNSANVSASLLSTELQRCRIPLVPKLAELLQSQEADLPRFMQEDPRGQKVPAYLTALGSDLMDSRQKMETELRTLQHSIEHIKEVVARQQSLTDACGLIERVRLHEVVADALRMQEPEFQQHRVTVERLFEETPLVAIERHKVLQIAINLLQNAVHACRDSDRADRRIVVRVDPHHGNVRLVVTDNGVGIAPENMTSIFSHGFTTKRDGHGFGLHGSALAAQDMGGSLAAHSDGPGRGASFTLTLPPAS